MRSLARRLACAGLAMAAGSSLPLTASGNEGAPQRGGTLVVPIHLGEPGTYDCHGASTVSIMYRVSPHYSKLVKIAPEKYPDVIGDLAENWKVSPDGLRYEFKLRDSIKLLVIQHRFFKFVDSNFACLGTRVRISTLCEQLHGVFSGLRNHHGLFTTGIQHTQGFGQGLKGDHAKRMMVVLGRKFNQCAPFFAQAFPGVQHGMNRFDEICHLLVGGHTLNQTNSMLPAPRHNDTRSEFGRFFTVPLIGERFWKRCSNEHIHQQMAPLDRVR